MKTRPNKANRLHLFVLISILLSIILWDDVVVCNKSGISAVYWSRFAGGTRNIVLGEGAHLKLPWDEIIPYDIRIQELTNSSLGLTTNGMELNTQWSIRFSPHKDKLPYINSSVGSDYINRIVVPETIGAIREVIGNKSADDLYSEDREEATQQIAFSLHKRLDHYGVHLDRLIMISYGLPNDMQSAIIGKMIAEQQELTYNYKLLTEEKEKLRKITEAEGINEFERISHISLLKWKGLETTANISTSNNSKLVIIGNDSNSLPLLFNNDN